MMTRLYPDSALHRVWDHLVTNHGMTNRVPTGTMVMVVVEVDPDMEDTSKTATVKNQSLDWHHRRWRAAVQVRLLVDKMDLCRRKRIYIPAMARIRGVVDQAEEEEEGIDGEVVEAVEAVEAVVDDDDIKHHLLLASCGCWVLQYLLCSHFHNFDVLFCLGN